MHHYIFTSFSGSENSKAPMDWFQHFVDIMSAEITAFYSLFSQFHSSVLCVMLITVMMLWFQEMATMSKINPKWPETCANTQHELVGHKPARCFDHLNSFLSRRIISESIEMFNSSKRFWTFLINYLAAQCCALFFYRPTPLRHYSWDLLWAMFTSHSGFLNRPDFNLQLSIHKSASLNFRPHAAWLPPHEISSLVITQVFWLVSWRVQMIRAALGVWHPDQDLD